MGAGQQLVEEAGAANLDGDDFGPVPGANAWASSRYLSTAAIGRLIALNRSCNLGTPAGSMRRGIDVIKALSLSADPVLIERAALYFMGWPRAARPGSSAQRSAASAGGACRGTVSADGEK
jgi:hypothetical protein